MPQIAHLKKIVTAPYWEENIYNQKLVKVSYAETSHRKINM